MIDSKKIIVKTKGGKKVKIEEILKDSSVKLELFSKEAINKLESRIYTKQDKNGKISYHTTCLIRKDGKGTQEVKVTPEEIVRQLYLDKLINEYKYNKSRIKVEVGLQMGRENTNKSKDANANKRIDILVLDKNENPYIVIEVKKPSEKDGYAQLESYTRYKNAPLAVLINGSSIEEYYHNKENKKSKTTKLERLSGIPCGDENLKDFLENSYTLKHLFIKNELQSKTLKKIILDFEDVVLANSGVDSFEEIFKLIFIKLYDEFKSADDNRRIYDKIDELTNGKIPNNYKDFIEIIKKIDDSKFRKLEFRSNGDDVDFKKRLNKLFEEAKNDWSGIFESSAEFKLSVEELRISVSYLQDIKLFNSNFEVIDDAFEHLVVKSQKGDKGQYFTPRYVIDMCVKMLNPKETETMIDTASGSCGFPMHSILYVWNKLNPKRKFLLDNDKTESEKKYVKNVFAIDFDEKSVRIGRLLNKIAGDGETNVLHLNSLHFRQWKNDTSSKEYQKIYGSGFEALEKICTDKAKDDKDYSYFDFDIVMANPPFAGDITNENLYSSYSLGKNKISRDILFIERNLNMLKNGGRMAIVLPQGRFNNSSDKYIRDFISQKARILAVIGLHGNVFKPHTGTKTSVLFLQKWGGDDGAGGELCPKEPYMNSQGELNYPIFFATMNKPSKDNSGEKIYVKNEDGSFKTDSHGHFIVEHDLYNHDGLTQDGIAEVFAEFAKWQNLSFWKNEK